MTTYNVIDNSGAKKARLIQILNNKIGKIGDIIIVSILDILPNKKIKKGEVHKALIVRTKEGLIRPDGTVLKFSENGIVLLAEDLSPIGTRIMGPIPMELNVYKKIVVLATKLI